MVRIKGNKLNERKKARKVSNDDLPKNEFKTVLKGKIRGDFDDSIELSHYAFEIPYYCDNPKDLVYP